MATYSLTKKPAKTEAAKPASANQGTARRKSNSSWKWGGMSEPSLGFREAEASLFSTASRGDGSEPVVQTKLTVSEPRDELEKEADQVAEQVMRTAEGDEQGEPMQGALQRKADGNPTTVGWAGAHLGRELLRQQEQKSKEQPRPFLGSPLGQGLLQRELDRARASRGAPLQPELRGFMESRFGRMFDDVRVHTDGRASELARAAHARAFTTGTDIFFNRGEFNPSSRRGQRLVAHELTHVVQQRGGLPQNGERTIQRVPTRSGIHAEPPRYSYSTHCGWIDWGHAQPGTAQATIDAVHAASERLRGRTGSAGSEVATVVPGMRSAVSVVGVLSGVTPSVEIKRPLNRTEVLSVALALYQFMSLAFEVQQQTTNWIGRSSFSEEDLPSNMLGFYRAALNLDRKGIERRCDAWSSERSLGQFEDHPFVQNKTFRPLSLLPGGSWPAIFQSIRPAAAGGSLMGVPTARMESMGSVATRGLGFFDPRLSIRSLEEGGSLDITRAGTGPERGPSFEVGPDELTTDVEYRWSLRDPSNNAYSMWGADGHQVHQFSRQRIAYIPSRTRELLRIQNITRAVVLCRIRFSGAGGASETRLLSLPVTFML